MVGIFVRDGGEKIEQSSKIEIWQLILILADNVLFFLKFSCRRSLTVVFLPLFYILPDY